MTTNDVRIQPTGDEPLLVAESVQKYYRNGEVSVHALVDLELEVRAGELVGVMGASGSGKTTLLNCLSGLDDIDGGRVLVSGRDLFAMSDAERTEHRARSMGFVFQSFNLIPVFTAVENVELPLLLVGHRPREARERAREMLAVVGLAHRTDHLPNQMSGGEQQRVTIARALVARPAMVWADEPTGNLDSAMAAQVIELLHRLNQDEGQTIVLVTHDRGHRPRPARGWSRCATDGWSTTSGGARRRRRSRPPCRWVRWPSRPPGQGRAEPWPPPRWSGWRCCSGASCPSATWPSRGRCCAGWRCGRSLRRPGEAVIVVLGSLLGTALIVASLAVGDSLDRSVRQTAYDVLGPDRRDGPGDVPDRRATRPSAGSGTWTPATESTASWSCGKTWRRPPAAPARPGSPSPGSS